MVFRFFDPSCNCTSGSGLEVRSWDDIADLINMQSNDEARIELMRLFKLNPEKYV